MNFGDERLPARFWAKVAPCPMSGCWLWLATLNNMGYGMFWRMNDQRKVPAHRVAYEALVGPVPLGLDSDHLCRVRSCCNPAHIEPVTRAENMRRSSTAQKTHCKHGHPLSGGNLRMRRKPPGRVCKTCNVAGTAAWRARQA